MYSKPPQLVFGFHGCDQKAFDAVILQGAELIFSTNAYDWLGSGIYFWENSYERALEWAQNAPSVSEPAVIGAIIDPGRCLNLTDREYTEILAIEYELMKQDYEHSGIPMPKNKGKLPDKGARMLDCAVIEHLHQFADQAPETKFDSVRGLFSEGDPVFPGSGIREKTHVQICVRNLNCIKGYFRPREPTDEYLIP